MMAGIAMADQNVNGYYRANGTYVQPYTRSSSDSSYNNNYSTQGNTNPYTGQQGTEQRAYNDRTPDYNQKTYGNAGTIPTNNTNVQYQRIRHD